MPEQEVPGVEHARAAVLAFLAAHPVGRVVQPRRLERMADVLARRLTSVTVVMENLYDPHNVSAVVRSAEGFGLDAVHVVEMPNRYRPNAAITRGADRWVHIHRHRGLNRCLLDLQAGGYTVCVADVGPGCVPIDQLPPRAPLAIVMGSERDGLSRRARSLADIRFTIPMAGFVESFNVSVSAAITLYEVTRRRRAHIPGEGELTLEDMKSRGVRWLRKTVRNADEIELRARK